jgi:hypothetical protein
VPPATSATPSAPATTTEPPTPPLPRGGTTIFPRYRVVAYYGTAGTGSLGVLGSASPEAIAGRLEKAAAPFATPGRQVLPAMELIVNVADPMPGPGGDYNHEISHAKARHYLDVARAHHLLLILDIQPGHSTFLPLVEHWKSLLSEPDVGLALDSEWRMPDGSVPGQVIGHSSASEINAVTAWLADLVREDDLPQKLLVLHQFTAPMIRDIDAVTTPPELAEVQQLDGFGTRAGKLAKYRNLQRPDQFHMGFKLFYTEDVDLMSPQSTLALKPPPEYISYQ